MAGASLPGRDELFDTIEASKQAWHVSKVRDHDFMYAERYLRNIRCLEEGLEMEMWFETPSKPPSKRSMSPRPMRNYHGSKICSVTTLWLERDLQFTTSKPQLNFAMAVAGCWHSKEFCFHDMFRSALCDQNIKRSEANAMLKLSKTRNMLFAVCWDSKNLHLSVCLKSAMESTYQTHQATRLCWNLPRKKRWCFRLVCDSSRWRYGKPYDSDSDDMAAGRLRVEHVEIRSQSDDVVRAVSWTRSTWSTVNIHDVYKMCARSPRGRYKKSKSALDHAMFSSLCFNFKIQSGSSYVPSLPTRWKHRKQY
jgi:hypothetical protein